MRENNHIMMRNSYEGMSSFKIRQPNEQSFEMRQSFHQQYVSKENDSNNRISSKDHKVSSSLSFNQKPQHYRAYENKERSRQLSYNSRGSNQTKHSIKMTDYIAQEAKNLINNRDKFKYDGQAHMRSSSMNCYPNGFKLVRGNNDKSFSYLNAKSTLNQPGQIPSFGIECRSTIQTGYNPVDPKSHSLSKYPTNSFKLSHPSLSYRIQNRNIKTEIDQRIERLKASSTSVQHRERLSKIKKIDQHKLENMDKINIKIKNILTTLENEEDHYKKRFTEGKNRIKTESSAFYDYKSHEIEEKQQQSLLSKYKKNEDFSQSRFSRFDISRQDTFNNSYSNFYQEEPQMFSSNHTKTALGKYCENNASSYYYYEDEEAMIKSSQSPFKSSPDRSFKKHSVDKDGTRSLSKYSKSSYDAVSSKPINHNESTKPGRIIKEYENSSNYSQSKYQKPNGHLLTNIPECETQIIQSKAVEYSKNRFAEAYHTFDTRKPDILNKDFKTQSTYKESFPQASKQKDQQNYQFQYPQNLQKYNEPYFPSSKNKFNAREAQTQRFMETKNFKDQLKRESENQNQKKKTNSIYFKPKENEKYMLSSNKNHGKSSVADYGNKDLNNEISKFNHKVAETNYLDNFKDIYKANKNSIDQSTYNHRNHIHEMTFDHKKKDNIYSDSIKETPRIQSLKKSYQNHKTFGQNKIESTRNNNFMTENDDKLDAKFKQYEKKLENYQKGMSASKILQSHRSENRSLNTKRDRSKSIQNSQDKYSNEQNIFFTNSNFKRLESASNFQRNDLVSTSQQNMEKLLSEIRRERQERQIHQDEQNYKAKKNQKNPLKNHKSTNQFKGNEVQKYCRLVSTPPNYSKRESHYFPKQDHEKFIENLRKDREEVAQLSQKKSRLNNCVSVENDRIQASNQRSESQNSKLSSNTIVKGKNIDEEISKIQRKMQQYNQMKKELNLDSKINTQRTQNQQPQTKDFEDERSPKKVKFQSKDCYSYSESKPRAYNLSNEKKQNDLFKIVAQENIYVKVRNSILKDHKTNEIKNYLDEEIERQSNRSRSISQKNEISLGKSRNIPSKQNMPPTTTTIDSPKYPNGNRKIVLGLAQNLVLNQISDQPSKDREDPVSKSEIKTPKLLRNLKNKFNQKCIVKKKAQKRGFRSQFINDLHDNEIISSAKKIQTCNFPGEDIIESTSRYSPQNKEILIKILDLIEKQILMDEKFRNEKKMFNAMTKSDKWNILMTEYIRQNLNEKRILLSDIVEIFTLTEEESNPFYSTRGVEFSLEAMVRTYGECRQNWKFLVSQISQLSYYQVTSCGINLKNLDIERKGFIEADDLTRFINMELNKYYRKRDLWLIWQRLASANYLRKEPNSEHKLSFEQFSMGFGLVKLENY